MTDRADLIAPVARRYYQDGVWRRDQDHLAEETHIDIVLAGDGGQRRTLWTAPLERDVLAVGHARLSWAAAGQAPRLVGVEGDTYTVELVEAEVKAGGEAPDPGHIEAERTVLAIEEFMSAPGLWTGTGCYHRTGLYDIASGQLVTRAEDIGRHNCIDRLAGWATMNGVEPAGLVLLLSCRVTGSLIAKASQLGARLVVSRAAVTTAAVETALAEEITLVGYVKPDERRLSVFADAAGRIV
jgi:FdhD protein